MSTHIRVLGSTGLVVDGSEISLGGPRAQALLALLALRDDQVVTTDWLIDQLWSKRPPRTARATVQSYVSRLRTAVGPEGRRLLRGVTAGYLLDSSLASIDVRTFEQLAQRGRNHGSAGRWPDARSDFAAALALYRGTPYTGLDDVAALVTERDRLDELRLQTRLGELESIMRTGQPADVVVALSRFTEERPWDEGAWRLLMLALYRSGRQAEALQAGARARRRLLDEHGLDPSPQLAEIERGILDQDPALVSEPPVRRPQLWLRPAATELFGRAVERGTLLQEWRTCQDSRRARLVVVRGEPGVGKSSLVAVFADLIEQRGGRVIGGRCLDAPRLPLQPWSELIGELPAENPPTASPESVSSLIDLWEVTAHRLFRAVTEHLTDLLRSGPVVMIAEDLHWAGAAALRLLDHVIASCQRLPLLVVATLRSTDAGSDPTATAALGEVLARLGPRVITLDGLDTADLRQMLADHGLRVDRQQAEALRHRTGGVPLLALEAVRGGNGMIEARLARLSGRAADVAELLDVAGNGTALGLLAAAVDGDIDTTAAALDELDAAGLVRSLPGSPVTVEFTHDLYREGIDKRLSAPRRLVLARRILRAADQLGIELPHSAHAAHALVAAGSDVRSDIERARDACRRAGAGATVDHDHDQALHWLANARQQAARLSEDRPELDLEFGMAARRAGRPGARDAFLAAAAAARRRRDAQLLARIGVGWSRGFFSRTGSVDDEFVAVLRDALVEPAILPDGLRAKAMAALAAELTWAAGGEERFELANRALSIARSTGDLTTIGYVLRGHQLTVAAADTLADRVQATEELLIVAEELDDVGLRFEAMFHRCGPAIERGEIGLIEAYLARAERIAESLHQPALLWSVGWSRASLLLWRGLLPDAEKLAREAAEQGQRAGQPEATQFLAAQLVEIRRLQGRLPELVGAFPGARTGTADGYSTARYLLAAGQLAGARALVAGALDQGRLRLRRDLLERPSLDNLAHCAAGLGLPELGAAVYTALLPLADTFGHTVIAHPVGHHWLGVLAAAAGRPEQAVRHLRRAVTRHRELQLPLMEAESAVALTRACRDAGDLEGAMTAAARARQLADIHHAPGVLTTLGRTGRSRP